MTWTAPPAATLLLDGTGGAQRIWLELTEFQPGSLSGGIGWRGLERTVGYRETASGCTSVSKDRANPVVAEAPTVL
jgi:hypothetical protein